MKFQKCPKLNSKNKSVDKTGNSIGVIALASSCNPGRVELGLKRINDLGFNYKVALDPALAYAKDTFLFSSDTPENRAKALHDLFLDPEVKVIISARGAYGSMELLPFLDFDLISKNPKCLVGFSDITAILLSLNFKSMITAIHGPMLSGAFAEDLSSSDHTKSITSLIDLLTAKTVNPFEGIKLTELKSGNSKKGFLCGGSLTMLTSLLGTPWQPQLRGSLLFLEDCNLKPYMIHRRLLQLKLGGQLESLSGVILGDFIECEHKTGPTKEDVFIDIFKDYDYPVLSGLPAGHGTLNLPVPFGVEAKIEGQKLVIFDSVWL